MHGNIDYYREELFVGGGLSIYCNFIKVLYGVKQIMLSFTIQRGSLGAKDKL